MLLLMKTLILILVFYFTINGFSAEVEKPGTIIKILQKRYSRIRDLKMNFVQKYYASGRMKKTESGQVFLRRPDFMRWEYQNPHTKLFVSDGKTIYFYLVDENQVRKSLVKDAQSPLFPFFFLLGGKNFKKYFSKIKWAKENPFSPENKVLSVYIKRGSSKVTEILLEYHPFQMQMRRITIINRARVRNDFVFTNIKENTGLKKKLFEFEMPLNAEFYGIH